ncbi:MAG: hypothetical protein H6896_08865 [Rhodovulum sp.]|nr:hypothetical protein [Rhodovulum sp.]
MGIYATAGAKLYIGESLGDGQPIGDLLPGDYSGETWTEVKKLENIGSLGDTSEAISVNIIGDARTYKVKGTRDAGTMQVVAALDYSDAGQTAVLAAEKTPHNYPFRLVFNDAPAGGTPSERIFVAMVMSASEQFDEANSVMKLNVSLAVNSNVGRVAAAGP